MSHPPPLYIQKKEDLETFCTHLCDQVSIGLDTEFIGEESYEPQLELIQILAGNLTAILDVQALPSLTPLHSILTDTRILKIVHAGRQDIELLHGQMGELPTPIFDTQIAAAMMGYGAQIGYAALVQRVTGIKLDKSHTLTNWDRRPLSQEELTYAAEDVAFLFTLYEHFREGLGKLNRLSWVEEECARFLPKPTDVSRDPRQRFLRVRGWGNLKPKGVVVLRELAAWREEEARTRNRPRGRILRDDLLLELSRRQPSTIHELGALRGVPKGLVERCGKKILQVIQIGQAVPKKDYPIIPKPIPAEPEQAGRSDLLQAALKACAHRAAIAPTLIATSADLQALVDAKGNFDELSIPLLTGWRRQIAGEHLLHVLSGQVAIRLHPQKGSIQISTPSSTDIHFESDE